jgi:membrane protein implicated in regulation of membrane protease activity
VKQPKWQIWTVKDGFHIVLAFAAASFAAFAVALVSQARWMIYGAFAVVLVLFLARIVRRQADRHARHEKENAAWLERRVGGPPLKKGRGR